MPKVESARAKMRRARPAQEGFARASMLSLIADRLDQEDSERAAYWRSRIDAIRQARFPLAEKRDMLEPFWQEAGAEGVLSIGQGIRRVLFDPLWQTALRSESPAVLFEKMTRFQDYGHSRNRMSIDHQSERRAFFDRYATNGPPPPIPENLLMCGVMIGILETLGCSGLHCDMPLVDGSMHRIRKDGVFDLPADSGRLLTTSWIIEWQGFTASVLDRLPSSDSILMLTMPRSCDADSKLVVNRVAALLLRDLGHGKSPSWPARQRCRPARCSAGSDMPGSAFLPSFAWCGSTKPAGF